MILPQHSLIAVVDDDAGMCRAMSLTLAAHGYAVRTYPSGIAYLESGPSVAPACLVADIRMPGLDGLALHRATRDRGLDVPTVFITATRDVNTIIDAMKCGAADVLQKPFSAEELVSAVSSALRDGSRARHDLDALASLWTALHTLTPREAEVVVRAATGRANKQIAAEIGTRVTTVKAHRSRAMRKLGARSLADLVHMMDRAYASSRRVALYVHGATIPRPAALDAIAAVLARPR